MEKDVEIGIFGGTGIYDSGVLENPQEITIDTPYGMPSDPITIRKKYCLFTTTWKETHRCSTNDKL